MEFNSILYVFIFLPIVLTGYLVVRRNLALSNILLVAASFFFYCYLVIWYAVPMALSSILDYFCGRKIADSTDEKYRKRILITSIIINLSLMSFFKYTGWITGEIATLLAVFGIGFSQINVPLPPGVSFYTFQTMSYTIDIYKREFTPQRNFLSYLSFVSFFPQLIAGPIERAKDLLPQLAATRKLASAKVASTALFLILFGLFQKIVLADNFGAIVDLVFRQLNAGQGTLPAGMGLVFAYAFAFQIYCDFAAYSTIARGTARLFSVELTRNFKTPYFAVSPSDFWERWHITLSRWLRDYLYIPLGGNRGGKLLTLRNLVITMLLGGLWHGAGIFFIVWGLYHGLLLVLYRLLPIDKILISVFGRRFGKAVAIILFFHLVCLGWIFFRSSPEQFLPIMASIAALPAAIHNAFATVSEYWAQIDDPIQAMSVFRGTIWQFVLQNWAFSVYLWGLVLFALPLWITDYIGWRNGVEFPDLFSEMHWLVKAAAILALIYGIAFFGQRQANEFIYFAF